MDGIRAIDATPADSEARRDDDDDLAPLREAAAQRRAEYLARPSNLEAQAAWVRAEQVLRHREESATRLASNGDAAPAPWPPPVATLPPPPPKLDLGRAPSSFTSRAELHAQIAVTEEALHASIALSLGRPSDEAARLAVRLTELKRRDDALARDERGCHAPRGHDPSPHLAADGRATVDCTPRAHDPPPAMVGNARAVADARIPLAESLAHGWISSDDELATYVDEYVAYTATRPELRVLHDDAVARGPLLVAEWQEREEHDRERAIVEARVAAQIQSMRVPLPVGIQATAMTAQLARDVARAVEEVASQLPIVGTGIGVAEVLTGRSLCGLGETIADDERATQALMLLAPMAGKVLVGGVREGAALLRVARASRRTTAEARAIIVTARELEGQRALVLSAFARVRAGGSLTAAEERAVAHARVLVAEMGGVNYGVEIARREAGVARAKQAANAANVEALIGTKASLEAPPRGYLIYAEQNGRLRVRRIAADDAAFAPLRIDGEGHIQWGSADRISRPGELAKALGPAPARHQAHHLVPDAVARESPLFEEAWRRGEPRYNIDAKTNGAWAPETAEARVASTMRAPVHNGSHPRYSEAVVRIVQQRESRLVVKYGAMDKVPSEELTTACRDVEQQARALFDRWVAEFGEKLR